MSLSVQLDDQNARVRACVAAVPATRQQRRSQLRNVAAIWALTQRNANRVNAMSSTGLEVFDRTLQTTNIWIDEIADALSVGRHDAWRVLGAVLHALRDRLQLGLSAHLAAELPLLVRGLYFDQWRPSEQNTKLRSLAEFLLHVSDGLTDRKPIGSIDATCAVFAVLDRHLDPGQAMKVRNALPEEVRNLWPEPLDAMGLDRLSRDDLRSPF
jgi:uncharacterized protein (DUF2267 family)